MKIILYNFEKLSGYLFNDTYLDALNDFPKQEKILRIVLIIFLKI